MFANPARTDPKVSPDGSQLSWLAPDESNVLNVWTGALDGENAHCVTHERGDPIEWYAWSGDGKQILYLHDNVGDEIPHLFSADLTTSNVRDLTPFRGVRAQNVLTDSRHPGSVFVAMNLRDRSVLDLYCVDLETGAVTLEDKNPGDVLTWKADRNFVVRAATAFDGKTGKTIIRVRDGADKPWRDLGFTDVGRLGIEPSVILHPVAGAVQAVEFNYTTPHWFFVDPKLKEDFERISREAPGFIDLVRRDDADCVWIVASCRSDAPTTYY